MRPSDLSRFRHMCVRFRWLAVFMTLSVGLLVTWAGVIVPVIASLSGRMNGSSLMTPLVWTVSPFCYLFGVWSIGQAMGDLARGSMFTATVANALRRVGLALGLGGVFSVFVATNLLRFLEQMRGGYLHFDVAGMTLGMIGVALFLLGRVLDQAEAVQAELDEMI